MQTGQPAGPSECLLGLACQSGCGNSDIKRALRCQAEAEYWRRSEGYRVGWSDQLLGFDCGGQQWVLEVSFPTGTLRCDMSSTRD